MKAIMTTTPTHSHPYDQLRFSAYRGTTTKSWQDVLEALTGGESYYKTREGKANIPRYTDAAYVTDTFGTPLAKVLWNPALPEVFFDVSEGFCKKAIPQLRGLIEHQVTSTNLFMETTQKFGFEDILTRCTVVQKANPRMRVERTGDWNRPRKGSRTYTIGSRSSACQIVLHQVAAKTHWYVDPDTDLVRLEWRFRPEDDTRKASASTFTPSEYFTFDMSPMACQLANLVLSEGLVRPAIQKAFSAARVPKMSEAERDDLLISEHARLLRHLVASDAGRDAAFDVMRAGLTALNGHLPAVVAAS